MSKPTYEQLIAYAAEELSPGEAARVEAHLARDRGAARTVARFRLAWTALAADDGVDPSPQLMARAKATFSPPPAPAPTRWWEHVEQVIATLIFDSRTQPALAGYRGRGSGFQLSFESDVGLVDLQAEPAGAPPLADGESGWHLMGQIDVSEPGATANVALVRRGQHAPTAEVNADPAGVFSMDAPGGRYDLYIRFGASYVALRDVDLR